jgi:amino-acid N-acetyltransferase
MTSADLGSAMRLLSDSELPTDGLAQTELWCVRHGLPSAVIGIAGLEVWGRQGLVRSVVVRHDQRRSGVGKALVECVLAAASTKNLTELYLITETAPGFFGRFGFESLERRQVSGEILNSAEFRGACPDTAPVMRLALRKDKTAS